MPRQRRNPEREERIDMEIVVDAYNESERWTGWHCYLENNLQFPFQAKCVKNRDISPLKKGEVVEVLGIIENEADDLPGMFVKIQWQKRTMGVPLEPLKGIKVDDDTKQAIEDWRYWCAQGYRF